MKNHTSEIQLRKIKNPEILNVKITGSDSAAKFTRQFYFDDITIYESVFIILLNAGNTTIGYSKISQGGVSGAICDPVIVAKYFIDSLAKGMILVHNHPSGNLKPSKEDKDLTQKIKNIVKLLDGQLLDHIILTEDEFFSFSDENIL